MQIRFGVRTLYQFPNANSAETFMLKKSESTSGIIRRDPVNAAQYLVLTESDSMEYQAGEQTIDATYKQDERQRITARRNLFMGFAKSAIKVSLPGVE